MVLGEQITFHHGMTLYLAITTNGTKKEAILPKQFPFIVCMNPKGTIYLLMDFDFLITDYLCTAVIRTKVSLALPEES